jgi:hypothetical protein
MGQYSYIVFGAIVAVGGALVGSVLLYFDRRKHPKNEI